MSHILERYRNLAGRLDSRFRVPGTSIRFGWDAILGLIPGVGDALGGVMGGYGLWVGFRLGAPPVILGRLLLNVAVDLALGTIPVLGDLFDIGWRSNRRNLALLEAWLEAPHHAQRQSRLLLAALVAGLLALAAVAVTLTVWLMRAAIQAFA